VLAPSLENGNENGLGNTTAFVHPRYWNKKWHRRKKIFIRADSIDISSRLYRIDFRWFLLDSKNKNTEKILSTLCPFFFFWTTDILYTIISTHSFSASPRIENQLSFVCLFNNRVFFSSFLRYNPNLALIHDEYSSRSATRRKEDDKKRSDTYIL